MSKKKIAVIVVVVVLLGAIGITYLRSAENTGAMATGNPVIVESAKRDTIVTTVNSKGEVSLLNSELIYSNIAAEVEDVLVDKNDIVKEGDPLIVYKERSRERIETQIREAELTLRSLQISLNDARTPATESELELARLNVLSAESAITDLETSMGLLLRDIENQERTIEDAKKDYENNKILFDAGAISQDSLDAFEKKVEDAEDALVTLMDQRTQNENKMVSLRDDLNYKKMLQSDIENRLDNQSTKNSIAQKEIAVQQQQLTVAQLKKDLEEFQQVIYSPIDGTVTSLSVSKGEITSTEKVLMEISNIDDFVIKIDINERNASKIAIGQSALIEGSVLGNESVSGKVSKIGFIAEEKQTTSGTERVVPVEITIDPSPSAELLKPGFSLEATITTDIRENVIVVPILSTLGDADGSNFVYIVNEDNSITKRTVEIGAYADMTVEVTGVEEGEVVVSQPTLDMYEGMVIMAMNLDEPVMMEEDAGEEAETTEGDGQ